MLHGFAKLTHDLTERQRVQGKLRMPGTLLTHFVLELARNCTKDAPSQGASFIVVSIGARRRS